MTARFQLACGEQTLFSALFSPAEKKNVCFPQASFQCAIFPFNSKDNFAIRGHISRFLFLFFSSLFFSLFILFFFYTRNKRFNDHRKPNVTFELIMVYLIAWKVACEQALRGTLASGREKEGELATHLWNLNVWIEKVNAKCWLVEMTLVMTSLPLARVYIRARFRFSLTGGNLTAQSTGNHRWNSNSRDVVASSPSFSRPAARAPLRDCSQALWKAQAYSSQICG